MNFVFFKIAPQMDMFPHSCSESELKVKHTALAFNNQIVAFNTLINQTCQSHNTTARLLIYPLQCPGAPKSSRWHFNLDMFVHSQSRLNTGAHENCQQHVFKRNNDFCVACRMYEQKVDISSEDI